MQVKQDLHKARSAIVKGFCKGILAMTADDRPCSPTEAVAAKFCIMGAIEHATGMATYGSRARACVAVLHNVLPTFAGLSDEERKRRANDGWPPCDLVNYNNATERTQEEILALFDKAIEAA